MIVNTGWLLDYLSPRVPLGELLTALPRVGLDVEATHVLAQELAGVRSGGGFTGADSGRYRC